MGNAKRKEKRWEREHRRKNAAANMPGPSHAGQLHAGQLEGDQIKIDDKGNVVLVFRPSPEQRARRAQRARNLAGSPSFQHPTGEPFLASEGRTVAPHDVAMVFNDALFMDAISGWGTDGPLYENTLDPFMLEILHHAREVYRGVELPEQYRRPEGNQ